MTTYTTNVEIIRCGGCGKRGVAITAGDGTSTRITSHKCTGSWTVESVQPGMLSTEDLRAESTSALRMVRGEAKWVKRRLRHNGRPEHE